MGEGKGRRGMGGERGGGKGKKKRESVRGGKGMGGEGGGKAAQSGRKEKGERD